MQWGDQRQDSQGSCTLAWSRRSSSGNPRRQRRERKWRRQMERRRYRHKQRIQTAMMVQAEASKEQHQIGGKSAVKFTPAQERTPTMRAPTTSIHSIPIFGSLYEACRFAVKNDMSERTQEAALVPAAVGSVTQGTRDRDHVLFSLTNIGGRTAQALPKRHWSQDRLDAKRITIK